MKHPERGVPLGARVAAAPGRPPDQSPLDVLLAALERLGIEIDPSRGPELVALLDRIARSPQNLTAIADTWDGVERHLVDSLAVLSIPESRDMARVVDVGSGGGFPGLALAIARPDLDVTLIESERRKAEWLQRASANTANVRAVHRRSEDVARAEREAWDTAVIRALAAPPAALELAAPLLADGGKLILWGGPRDPSGEERAALAGRELGLRPAGTHAVDAVPGAERHLHVFRKVEPTPPRFPRRPGRATKRPLA